MSSAYAAFVKMWGSTYKPREACGLADLDEIEVKLGLLFPVSYREAMSEVGPVHAKIELLDGIVDNELDQNDLSELFLPRYIEEALSWRDAGLPHNLLPIGSDCMGNMFCFNMTKLGSERVDDTPIWFFDHDFVTAEEIAPTFEAWIAAFLTVPMAND